MERKPIKLLIMDIDGTLVTNKKEISPATCKALIDLQNNGVRLALASGRPAKGMLRFARQLEMDKHHGLLISSNGAKAAMSFS
ncbi:HAD-IIB family hydrolase [Allobaculum sp. JKK-2023]|uniref:HAD-IIB family hydrolase n=1 Tax=Allobaculum sp. JKK-2023 TaxID=3108943 RepID=UPI002B061B10|nr:HAD-IIB family hydrolase [Allobaculum sp. JKK-2023]